MRDFLTVVSGVPRSGTSLVMRMLHAGGYPVLMDNIRQPDESNPHGYFEYGPVKTLGREKAWVSAARGKAVKVIYRLLTELPPDVPLKVLFLERDLREVVASQTAMLSARADAAALQDERLIIAAFEKELTETRQWLQGKDVLYLPFAGLITAPSVWAEAIATFLCADLDCASMAAAVDPKLYRQRLSDHLLLPGTAPEND